MLDVVLHTKPHPSLLLAFLRHPGAASYPAGTAVHEMDAYCNLPSNCKGSHRPGLVLWCHLCLVPVLDAPRCRGWEVTRAHLVAWAWKEIYLVHPVPWINLLFPMVGPLLDDAAVTGCSPTHSGHSGGRPCRSPRSALPYTT